MHYFVVVIFFSFGLVRVAVLRLLEVQHRDGLAPEREVGEVHVGVLLALGLARPQRRENVVNDRTLAVVPRRQKMIFSVLREIKRREAINKLMAINKVILYGERVLLQTLYFIMEHSEKTWKRDK